MAPTILFDSWTSQIEVQDVQPPRLETLFGLIAGNGWTWGQTKNPITRGQLLNAEGAPIPGVLVIPTRYNELNLPGFNPAFTGEELSAIVDYVMAGGSLLHMTNHSFFTVNDKALAARFNITLADEFLTVPGATICSLGLNYQNPVLAGGTSVQSVCAHDGCRMTVDPDNPYNPIPLASFVPAGATEPALFALSMTPGAGRVVYAVNSGWIGDYGTNTPAWGLMPYGNNLAFILTILGWLLGSVPPMEPVLFNPRAGKTN